MRLSEGRLSIALCDFNIELSLSFFRDERWYELLLNADGGGFVGKSDGICARLSFNERAQRPDYRLDFESSFQSRLRLELCLKEEKNYFHLVPCNIFGDNNLNTSEPGHFPNLTTEYQENTSCSPLWEFRADRASHPVSILCCDRGAVGISIEPYSDCPERPEGFIRNGLFARLPGSFGTSLGYGNCPKTFINKDIWGEPTAHLCKKASADGTIYAFNGHDRQCAHQIIKAMYAKVHEQPVFNKSLLDAAKALYEAMFTVGWRDEYDEFADCICQVPADTLLKAWRPNVEIGWTGGAATAYPLAVAEFILGESAKNQSHPGNPRRTFDRIVSCYNEKSGFLNDITKPDERLDHKHSKVDGWWSGYVVKDCHCAYTNGSAVYYLFKTLQFMKNYRGQTNVHWLETGLKVLDTVIELQRDDGCLGYTYSTEERKVLDWEGFASCWFAAAMPYAYLFTNNQNYLDAAKKSLDYYSRYVFDLTCFGTPMDTWKSVDEEGCLAFIRAAGLLHKITGEKKYLDLMESGADFEYLWRYAYRVRPEFEPLKNSNWNSCGGSVTSVSNPHIHPMGVFIASDLKYLAQHTGSDYHLKRAEDSIAWAMNCLEQYPDVVGYGPYGVLTERWCPSDGLVVEKFSDGSPSSIWFCYNIWAASAVLEAIAEQLLKKNMEV